MGLSGTYLPVDVMRSLLYNWHPQRLLNAYLVVVALFVVIQTVLINVDLFELVPSLGPSERFERESISKRPIDVVYTWVNGSDPKFVHSLHRLARSQLVSQLNVTCGKWACEHPTHLLPIILIRPQLAQAARRISRSVKSETFNQSATLIYFHDSTSAREFGSTCVRIIDGIVYKLTNLCLSSMRSGEELKLESVVELGNVSAVPKHAESDPLRYLAPGIRRHLTRLEVSGDSHHLLYTTRRPFANNLTQLVALIRAKLNSSIHYRFEVASPIYFRMTDEHFFLHQMRTDNTQSSRFADNDELKYSLRSLHKHAPWIRTVYLITNGQIPRWLNLANPRVRVVLHRDIFPNQSHLPTFSSAAIESHLHRIANLSDHFLYFNDDIILGASIYPDDFYTESRGHRVYLSWPVPNCAEGCPLNWLHDGYCDKACNSTQCLWDGGDCLGSGSPTNTSQASTPPSSDERSYHSCSSNCLSNWLGDSFCDQVCNNAQCGYDMADCGVRNFETLHSIQIQPNHSLYYYSNEFNIFYLNLTHLIPKENEQLQLLGANYHNISSIYNAVLNLEHQVLTLILYPNEPRTHIIFNFIISYRERIFSFCLNLIPENDTSEVRQETRCANTSEWNKVVNHWNQTQVNNTRKEINKMINAGEQWPRIVQLSTQPSESCQVNVTELSSEMRHQWAQVQFHYETSLLTDNGRAQFYRQLRLLICNSSSGELDSFKHFVETHLTNRKHSSFRSRRLLDTYADSLVYVNYLYNQHFGVVMRKAPAHMAHYIDKQVMTRLQENFPEEFEKTSEHRIRHSQDMQFAFSYFYFLMSETQQLDIMQILHNYDTDSSGNLNWNELRTLLSTLKELPLKRTHFNDFLTQMDLCCNNCTERHKEVQLSLQSLASCGTLRDTILERHGKSLANRFEVVNSEDSVAFKMLRSNETLLEQELDELRRNSKKFICLNDNFEYTGNETQERQYKVILRNFYQSLFPHKSPFEYADHYENKYLYLDQYREWQRNEEAQKWIYLNLNYLFLIFNVAIVSLYCISRVLHRYLR